MSRHYLDHASTSPPRPAVVAAMTAWLEGAADAADPGRLHAEGRQARFAVEQSREAVAAMLGARPRQVVFTSGGTEAVNAAVWGASRAKPGCPVLLSDVEHSCVRDSSVRAALVSKLSVDHLGRIESRSLESSLDALHRSGTEPALVHCQAANHEVGTLQDVHEVAEICRRHGATLHVDACAAAGHVPLAFEELGADLLSVSAHKFGGPPGIGALLIRRGLRLDPLLVGGDQERARRAGLENTPAIVGFAAAASELSPEVMSREAAANRLQTERLLRAATAVEGVEALGDTVRRVPHIVCLSVRGVEAEPVLLGLDRAGVAVHSGSSCSSESLRPSPVLEAMGADAQRSLRLSVGWSTTEADVDAFASAFATVVAGLRGLRSGAG